MGHAPGLVLSCAPLGIIHAVLLEYFSDNGDGRVDGIGNNKNEGLGGNGCDSSRQVFHNPAVDLGSEQSDLKDRLKKWEANFEQVISCRGITSIISDREIVPCRPHLVI